VPSLEEVRILLLRTIGAAMRGVQGFNLEMVDDVANARDISENVEENLMLGKFSHQRPPLAL